MEAGVDLGLEGRGVLVTGGSGGIGQAVCRVFAAEGARVAVHYHRRAAVADRLAAELPGAVAVGGDLGTEEGAEAAVAGAAAAFGRLDVCVHAAGVWPEAAVPLWQLGLDRWEATMRADLTASFLVARAFLVRVAAQGTGNLVFVGSTAALFGEAGHADYAAAKAAVVYGLTRSLKNEIVGVAPTGRVNAVCPGWTATPMTRSALADPTLVPRVTRTMALRKLATVDDVAAQVAVLASDRVSGHVTGQVVEVAGGMEGRVVHAGA
jgi:3-oxoacyl-[acyl-carrier protein] reductase